MPVSDKAIERMLHKYYYLDLAKSCRQNDRPETGSRDVQQDTVQSYRQENTIFTVISAYVDESDFGHTNIQQFYIQLFKTAVLAPERNFVTVLSRL